MINAAPKVGKTAQKPGKSRVLSISTRLTPNNATPRNDWTEDFKESSKVPVDEFTFTVFKERVAKIAPSMISQNRVWGE